MLRRRVLPVLALAGGACAHASGGGSDAPLGKGSVAPPLKVVTPARIVALPDASASLVEKDPDGSTRFISRGMRVLARPDGSLERSRQTFPTGRVVRALKLPARLGGGFLFHASGSGSTHLWKAEGWTDDVVPFANVDFDAERIVDGFDRIYLQDQRSFDVVALDPQTGKATDLGPLPASPAYSSMAFADAWLGVVEVPFRGVLATFDAGASWRPLGLSQSYGVYLDKGEIAINSSLGRFVLDASGRLRQRAQVTDDDATFVGAGKKGVAVAPTVTAPAPPEPPPPPAVGPLGKLPLREAILHGMPDAPDSALVAKDGVLARVRLRDGRLLDVAERAFPPGSSCHGVPLGDGFGFVCGQERGGTVVYAYKKPLSLEPVMRFDEPRFVAPSGNGALVVRGPCVGKQAGAVGAYCIRTRDGRQSEMRVRGDLGVERLVALSDGGTAVLVPPRLGAPGTLTIVAADGSAKTVKLKLPKDDVQSVAMLKKGLWLEGFIERESAGGDDKPKASPLVEKVLRKKGKNAPGSDKTAKAPKPKWKKQLAGWVVAAGPFVGVRVDLDGAVHVGRIESDIDRALISTDLALVLGRGGSANESIDGGFTWREVDLPAETADPVARARSGESAERGCSRVGCVSSSWMRVGWRGKTETNDIEVVDAPKYSPMPASRGGRWNISCAPTGEVVGPAPKPERKVPERDDEAGVVGIGGVWGRHRWGMPPPAAPTADELKSSEWLAFKGVAPPPKKAAELGFDMGTEHLGAQVRGYAWGARGASWDRVGSFVLRAYDSFSLNRAVWSTATARAPWNDAIAASQVFGRDYNQPSAWFPVLEPSGRAAAMLVNARGTTELLLLEEGRGAVNVQDAAKWGLYQLSGAVKVGSTWYLGSYVSGSSFRLFKVDAGRVVQLRDYPMTGGWRPNTTLVVNLVRNARGDALGIWVEARRTRGAATQWFVYSIDPETGDALDMLTIDPADLARLPPACAQGADGWLLVGDPPVEPYVDYVQSADGVRSRNMQAKMLVQPEGLCVEVLSAEADTDVPARIARADASFASGRESIPMVLDERGRAGRRWGFRCVR
ncbi:MAG: hypothetical protein HS104_22815 [Polyangiaceae bacterium]|nr:hypothetical protein [Polyangiaceae bacterium]MCL4750114.1 hypothetical protein [Myxococcales bacterium]